MAFDSASRAYAPFHGDENKIRNAKDLLNEIKDAKETVSDLKNITRTKDAEGVADARMSEIDLEKRARRIGGKRCRTFFTNADRSSLRRPTRGRRTPRTPSSRSICRPIRIDSFDFFGPTNFIFVTASVFRSSKGESSIATSVRLRT